MMIKNAKDKREQIQFVSASALVPENHLLRDIERAIDFSFIYELVEDKYSKDHGRPSLDPVMLIKIPFIQYLYGISSMRQTIKDIEVNAAYRWFLGLDLTEPAPHFSTFGKNYTRRFKGTDLFEQIFQRILEECFSSNLVDPSVIFVDATHIKASANKNKSVKILAEAQALNYEAALFKEINQIHCIQVSNQFISSHRATANAIENTFVPATTGIPCSFKFWTPFIGSGVNMKAKFVVRKFVKQSIVNF